jgi:hypothetical protein
LINVRPGIAPPKRKLSPLQRKTTSDEDLKQPIVAHSPDHAENTCNVKGRDKGEMILKRFLRAGLTVLTVFAVMNSTPAPASAPSDGEVQDMARSMGMDPRQCDALQSRIDQVTSVANSSLAENEKAARLVELLNQAIESMKQSASNDPEVSQIVNQYLGMMQGLVAAARNQGNDKSASPNSEEDLSKLKIMTQTYLQMMKMMCPKLRLPESMAK